MIVKVKGWTRWLNCPTCYLRYWTHLNGDEIVVKKRGEGIPLTRAMYYPNNGTITPINHVVMGRTLKELLNEYVTMRLGANDLH